MGTIYVARDRNRKAVMLPLGGTRENPNVIIPLSKKLERSELDTLIRAACAKQGLTEKQTEMLVEAAEEQYEYRMKVKEASAELHMRIAEQARYPNLKHGGIKPYRKKSQN
jgi:hypothetical protein